jgi:hypothetical protein
MTDDLNDTRGLIETFFDQNFTSVAVAFPAMPYNPQADTPYIAPTVYILKRGRIGLGIPERRISGNIIVQCFAPSSMEQAQTAKYLAQAGALALADEVATLLDTEAVQGICLEDISVVDAGDTGEFWQVNVTCPFWRDTV